MMCTHEHLGVDGVDAQVRGRLLCSQRANSHVRSPQPGPRIPACGALPCVSVIQDVYHQRTKVTITRCFTTCAMFRIRPARTSDHLLQLYSIWNQQHLWILMHMLISLTARKQIWAWCCASMCCLVCEVYVAVTLCVLSTHLTVDYHSQLYTSAWYLCLLACILHTYIHTNTHTHTQNKIQIHTHT